MPDRPTLIYDGTTPWRDIGRGDQVLVDAITRQGAIVRVPAREQPYTEICTVFAKDLARWSVYFEPGAVFSLGARAGQVGRFIIDTPLPDDEIGILELFGFDQRGGNGVSQQNGHLLLKDCHLSGRDHPKGGDSGAFGSHSGGLSQFSVFDNTDGDYHGSHNCYMEGTFTLFLGGTWHSADPSRWDDRSNQFDSARSMSKVCKSKGLKVYTTDPDPEAVPRGFSSMCLGTVSQQFGWHEDLTVVRTCPPRPGAPFMVASRDRQSWAGANRKYVGNAPDPGDMLIPELGNKWAWFAAYLQDKYGEPLNKAFMRNPAFFLPDYWERVRAAGIATAEERWRNPHISPQVFIRPTFINHGERGVGILGEGTAPVGPKNALGSLHDPPRRYPRGKQDDYLDLPPRWVERSAIYVVAPTFQSDDDAGKPFVRYVARDASLAVPNRTSAAFVDVDGSGPVNDTMVPIYEFAEAPAFLPDRAELDVPGFAEAFPDYAHHIGGSSGPVDPVERRLAIEQRRLVDR